MSKNGKLPENIMKVFSECEKDYNKSKCSYSGSYWSNGQWCQYR